MRNGDMTIVLRDHFRQDQIILAAKGEQVKVRCTLHSQPRNQLTYEDPRPRHRHGHAGACHGANHEDQHSVFCDRLCRVLLCTQY